MVLHYIIDFYNRIILIYRGLFKLMLCNFLRIWLISGQKLTTEWTEINYCNKIKNVVRNVMSIIHIKLCK